MTDANVEVLGAARVSDHLDLGLGLDAQYASATLTQALPNLLPLAPDALQRLSGHGWDYGWDAGAQYHPSDRLTLAASYRSKIGHTLRGDVSVAGLLGPLAGSDLAAAGAATFNTPAMATLGARWKATDRLWLNAQVQRVDWSQFRAITVKLAGATQVTPQDYRSTTTVALGADYAGRSWHRAQDKVGAAFVTNGISADQQAYLRLGGKGFLLGDGSLNYGRENIAECYYTAHLWRGVFASADVQGIVHPGYNRDRGPVVVSGLRLHVDF